MCLVVKDKMIKCNTLLLIYFLIISGCTSGKVRHGFSFDARYDSPDIEILNYRYGSTGFTTMAASESRLRSGIEVSQQNRIFGSLRVGDELYVKWKVKSSGLTYEDTVDLKKLMGSWVRDDDVYFIVAGSQLHVYLVTDKKWETNPCFTIDTTIKPRELKNPDDKILRKYCSRKIVKIYPEATGDYKQKFWR